MLCVGNKKEGIFFFLCVIPSEVTIAFLVPSILEESCRAQILEDVDSEVIPSS